MRRKKDLSLKKYKNKQQNDNVWIIDDGTRFLIKIV